MRLAKIAALALVLLAIGPRPAYPAISQKCVHIAAEVGNNSRLSYQHDFGREARYEDPAIHQGLQVAADSEAFRCSPEALEKRPRCGKLKFSTPADGHIYFDPATRHYSYEPNACVLRRLSAPEARACLAQVGPILFIGDSVTRYQYLTLAHFLAAGSYQHPYDGLGSLSNANSQDPKLPGGKYDRLWHNAVQQVRAHDPAGSLRVNHSRSKHWEQAHLQLNAPRAAAAAAAPAEAKRQRGRGQVHLYYYNLNTAGPKTVQRALDWALAQRRDYSHVIINVCAHYHGALVRIPATTDADAAAGGGGGVGSGGGSATAAGPAPTTSTATSTAWVSSLVSDVTQSLELAAERLPASVQLVWKSCTTPIEEYRNDTEAAEAEIASYCKRYGVDVYDVRRVSMAAVDQRLMTTWHYGSVHFLQFMYEQFNDLLLNILCAAKP